MCSQQLGVECLQNKKNKKQSWSGNSTGRSLQSVGSNNQEGTANTFFLVLFGMETSQDKIEKVCTNYYAQH